MLQVKIKWTYMDGEMEPEMATGNRGFDHGLCDAKLFAQYQRAMRRCRKLAAQVRLQTEANPISFQGKE